MNIYKKLFVFALILTAFVGFGSKVHAMTPALSLVSSGTDNVLVTVTADPNSSVVLYYNLTYGMQNAVLGTTNYNGYFTTVISANNYNITAGSLVYVMVNGQQSVSVAWPSYYSYNSNLSLSHTNVSLTIGQTSYVTANNSSYGSLYVSNNSNSNVVTVGVVGNSISLYGVNSGSSTVMICQSSYTSSCGTVYVTVSGGYNYNSTNTSGFLVSNLNLSVGNYITLSSPNNTGLYVSTNSNSSVASVVSSTAVSGCFGGATFNTTTGQPCYYQTANAGSVTISAVAVGTSNITLCQNNYGSNCSTIMVNVTGSPYVYNPGSVLGASTCYLGNTTLRYGMSGPAVTCLQTLLSNKGYLVNNYSSYFDLQTQNAVISFQQARGLFSDGVVGARTKSALMYQ